MENVRIRLFVMELAMREERTKSIFTRADFPTPTKVSRGTLRSFAHHFEPASILPYTESATRTPDNGTSDRRKITTRAQKRTSNAEKLVSNIKNLSGGPREWLNNIKQQRQYM